MSLSALEDKSIFTELTLQKVKLRQKKFKVRFSKFIDFFKNKQHECVPGSPIIPDNDPTLLFINAGNHLFKK